MPKVMLIEDDITMLSLLSTLLEMEGFQVIATYEEHIDNYLDVIVKNKPDLCLLDVNLRQASGLDLLKRVRQNSEISNIRILMTSGMDFSSECRQAGADGFILKPYMPDDLIRQIRNTLGLITN